MLNSNIAELTANMELDSDFLSMSVKKQIKPKDQVIANAVKHFEMEMIVYTSKAQIAAAAGSANSTRLSL